MANRTHRNIKMPEIACRKCERHKKGKGLGQTSLLEKLTALGKVRTLRLIQHAEVNVFAKKMYAIVQSRLQLWGKAFC
jgi:hypothetical protein